MESIHQAKIGRVKEVFVSFDSSEDEFIPKITPSSTVAKPPPSKLLSPEITFDEAGRIYNNGICINSVNYQTGGLTIEEVGQKLDNLEAEVELHGLKQLTRDSSLTIEKLQSYKNQSPIPIFDESLGKGAVLYRKRDYDHLWAWLYDFVFESASLGDNNLYVQVINSHLDWTLNEAMYKEEMQLSADYLWDFFSINEEKIFKILHTHFNLKDALYDIGYEFIRESEFGMVVQSTV